MYPVVLSSSAVVLWTMVLSSILSAGVYLSNLWPKGGVNVMINLLVWLPALGSGMCF
jgi:hypothetical protein